MMFTVVLQSKAKKQFARLPHAHRARVLRALKAIEADPFSGKKLGGDMQGVYSARAWPYRILYEIHQDRVLAVVLAIGHRQGVYD